MGRARGSEAQRAADRGGPELSHLSIRPFRKPSGDVVPLLQVAPSKTEEERVLPVSPALAHVLSRVVQRHTARFGSIPVIARHDYFERSYSPPLPYLFQHHYSTGRGQVFSDGTIRKYLARAAEQPNAPGSSTPTATRCGRPRTTSGASSSRTWSPTSCPSISPTSSPDTAASTPPTATSGSTHRTCSTRTRPSSPGVARGRPSDEYRQPTPEELRTFAEHFGRRRVELGDCVRPYGSGCTHEHACLRCQFLTVHPGARPRLDSIEADLNGRIKTASEQAWLGDVE